MKTFNVKVESNKSWDCNKHRIIQNKNISFYSNPTMTIKDSFMLGYAQALIDYAIYQLNKNK